MSGSKAGGNKGSGRESAHEERVERFGDKEIGSGMTSPDSTEAVLDSKTGNPDPRATNGGAVVRGGRGDAHSSGNAAPACRVKCANSLASSAMHSSGYVTGWGTLALINAGIAQGKNRSGMNWFLLSLLFGPIATLVLVAFAPKQL